LGIGDWVSDADRTIRRGRGLRKTGLGYEFSDPARNLFVQVSY